MTNIAAALKRRFPQFDWAALIRCNDRTLAEELTIPDDSWLVGRGDPYRDLRPLLGLQVAGKLPRPLSDDEQLGPWGSHPRRRKPAPGKEFEE